MCFSGATSAVISSTARSGGRTPVPICHRETGICAPVGVLARRASPRLVRIHFGIDMDLLLTLLPQDDCLTLSIYNT